MAPKTKKWQIPIVSCVKTAPPSLSSFAFGRDLRGINDANIPPFPERTIDDTRTCMRK